MAHWEQNHGNPEGDANYEVPAVRRNISACRCAHDGSMHLSRRSALCVLESVCLERSGFDCQDGSYYIGQFRWGVPHGLGRMVYIAEIGEVYEGEFVRGKRKGTGKLLERGQTAADRP